jgi:RNA polymerase-associated protein CTR9
MLLKRQEYKEKTKGALLFGDMPSEKKSGKGRKKQDIVSDSGSDVGGRSPGDQQPRRWFTFHFIFIA